MKSLALSKNQYFNLRFIAIGIRQVIRQKQEWTFDKGMWARMKIIMAERL
jgi:hypothetical protein